MKQREALAYTAGIIDGEGCIGIYSSNALARKRKRRLILEVSVTNTNEWLINWIYFNFRGCIYKKRMLARHYKQVYLWSASSLQAKTLLELLLPYLRIKKPQAEIALQFQSHKSHNSGGKTKSSEAYAVEEAERILIQSYNDCRRGKSLEEVK